MKRYRIIGHFQDSTTNQIRNFYLSSKQDTPGRRDFPVARWIAESEFLATDAGFVVAESKPFADFSSETVWKWAKWVVEKTAVVSVEVAPAHEPSLGANKRAISA